MDKDLYGLLGVSRTASQDEIKSAFRKKAKQYHPDIHDGDKKVAEEKFKEIGEAYKVLSDPETRKRYDTFGYSGVKGGAGFGGGRGGFSGGIDFDMSDIFSDFGDIFGDIFGFGGAGAGAGRRGGAARAHGDDIRYDTAVDFEQVKDSIKQVVEINRKEACETCKGEGIKPGTSKTVCHTCGGQGKVRTSQGFFSMVRTCPECGGEGKVAKEVCPDCGGKKVKIKKRKIEVKIPAGVTDQSYLKIRGEGHAGLNGGIPGDLFVVINIRPHEIFEREGDDIVLRLPIAASTAALGDEMEIPTIYGAEKLKVPAGIQTGEQIVLKSKGFPRLGSRRHGNMRVVISVETPRGMNSKLKDAYKNVKLFEKEDNYGHIKKEMKKIKKYLEKK